MTQHESILAYLESGKSLTPAEALLELGIYALSQRCGELKQDGHPIQSEWVERNGKRFKRYFLQPTEFQFR